MCANRHANTLSMIELFMSLAFCSCCDRIVLLVLVIISFRKDLLAVGIETTLSCYSHSTSSLKDDDACVVYASCWLTDVDYGYFVSHCYSPLRVMFTF
jgi:hypothetical protein